MKQYYTIVVLNHNVAIYSNAGKEAAWISVLINGEEWTPVNSKEDLAGVIHHFNYDLNLTNDLKGYSVVVLYETEHIQLLEEISLILSGLQCTDWQVLAWEIIAQRASDVNPIPAFVNDCLDPDWMRSTAMPTLEAMLCFHEQALASELTRVRAKHEETKEDLQKQRFQLEQELELLRKQIKTIQQPNIESLLVYLPVIYRNFWTHIKPEDLALLAGTYDIPDIPSPYPEPDDNTIAIMKKRLQNLPDSELQKIKSFCQEMTHRLTMRPEMKFLLED